MRKTGAREQASHAQVPGERLKQVYFGSLVERLLEKMQAKRRRRVYKSDSLVHTAKAAGINYETLVRYLVRRDRPIPVLQLDKILFAAEMSVLDLLEPAEIFAYIMALDWEERQGLRINFNSLLDRLNKREHNRNSSADSQMQTAAEPEESRL